MAYNVSGIYAVPDFKLKTITMDYRKLIKEEIAKLHTAKGVKVNPKLDSDLGEQIVADICGKVVKKCRIADVGVSVLSDEEMREPIENALYATRRFLTTQATDLAEGIIQYIKDAGYIIVRTER